MNNKDEQKMVFLSPTTNRVDKILVDFFANENQEKYSRTKIQKLIKDKHVFVNNKLVSSNYIVKIDDEIIIELSNINNKELDLPIANNISIPIVYEDEYLLVINKPNNLVVHPSAGHLQDTLVNGLLALSQNWSSIGGPIRPGIVHRIDKQTTGLLVVAKNDFVHQQLQSQIQERKLKRYYLALVVGIIKENKIKIDAPIGRNPYNRKAMMVTDQHSRNAITNIVVKKRFSRYTYIECELETGRTHQIRAHLQYINYPVLGDNVYGYNKLVDLQFGQYLHAYKLNFYHPILKKEMTFIAELPDKFQNKLNELEIMEEK